MAIRQPDSEAFNHLDYFGESQVILVPIHESRIGEEGYERMLRDARHFADTYDKILVGVLEAYCTYSDHPILGNIPVLPIGEAGSGTVPRPLTVYESREEAWRAVAQGLAELLESYRPFWQQGIRGSVFFDKERNAWCFDKGRRDGVSIWHREVQVQTPSGAIGMTIGKVLPEITVLQPLAGFNVSPEENLRAFITHLPQRYINFLAEDHADNKALIRELQEDQELQEHGVRWTTVLAGLEYVLHFTQTHCYLTRAFEDTEGAPEENALNPYRPLTKPIDLSAGIWMIKEFLKQVVNWEFLKCLEAPYNEEFSQGHFEINVFQGEDGKWKAVPKDGDLFQVDMYPGERRGVDDFSNTIRIELVNRSRRNLYISAFQLTSFLGSLSLISEMEHLELKAGEKIFLPGETDGNIPIRLEHRTLAYNLPQEYLEIKILASPEPFSTFGYRMKDFPGPPGSEYFEEDGYFMEKGTNIGMIRALEGVFIAPLLNISLDNPAYNLPNSVRLEELLRRPDAAPFLRALYFDSLHLAPRYELKQQIELQAEESPGSKMAEPLPAAYVHTPNGLDILESQLQQLYPRLREKAEKPILVALGDSWFNQAQPVDIPHFLMEDFMVIHAPLGDWGQLEEAFRRLEKAIASLPSITLLLSPMGERLLDGLEGLVQEGAPDNTDDIRQILSSEFFRRLDELEKEWERGFGFLSRIGSRLQGVVHGYDYFAFEEFGGPAFYQRPREWRRDLGVFVIDILNARLKIVLDRMEATNIYYLDLRNTLEPGDWTATLTPASTGFRKLAGAVSLFIGNQYKDDREPYPGTEYFLWQVALMEGILEFYIDLIEAYPKGKHRAWAEKRLMEAVKQKQDADFGEAVRPVPARRSWFLGIGINRYLHFQSLRNAVKDVQDIAALLQERYGLDVTDTTILLDEQATRKNIIAQLEEMVSKVGPEDKVLIYYSGHGHFNEKTGKGFWIPVDADAGSPAGYLPNVRIKDYMEVIPAYHTFLISDSLLSGSLFSEGKLRNTNEAIEDLDSNPSRWGLCSGRHDEEVYDGNPGENSPFAASILEVLRSNNEPALNVGKLIELVLKQARRHYRYLPEGNPFFDVGHEGGQYIFRLEGAERPPDEQAQPQSQSAASEAPSQQEPETLQSLQRRANELISSNQLGELFELLDKELEQGTDARERLAVYQKEYEQLEKQRRRYKRPSKQLDRDLASLADAVVELVEELEPPPAPPKEGSSADIEPLATVATETPNTEQPKTGSFTDPRDGRTYRTVELNGLRWMAENLNYDIRGGWFFENDPNTGRQYGRFYDWETAQKAAPPGWRLPTDEEWASLVAFLGGPREAFTKLQESGEGEFDARLVDGFANFWSGTENGADAAWCYSLSRKNGELRRVEMKKTSGLSCRCVQALEEGDDGSSGTEVGPKEESPARETLSGEEPSPEGPQEVAEPDLALNIPEIRNRLALWISEDNLEEIISYLGRVIRPASKMSKELEKLGPAVREAQQRYGSHRYGRSTLQEEIYFQERSTLAQQLMTIIQQIQPEDLEKGVALPVVEIEKIFDRETVHDPLSTEEVYKKLLEGLSDDNFEWLAVSILKSIPQSSPLWQEYFLQMGNVYRYNFSRKTGRLSEESYETGMNHVKKALADAANRAARQIKPPTFTDPRDGRTYRTVEFNGLRWMAENLNFDVGDGCWFYDDDPKNGEMYGRLYTWEAAQKACPPGWRLPTDEEWNRLRQDVGGPGIAFETLQEEGAEGFAIALAGMLSSNGRFLNIEGNGYYWSSTEENPKEAWSYKFRSGSGRMYRALGEKTLGFSCRCVMDVPPESAA